MINRATIKIAEGSSLDIIKDKPAPIPEPKPLIITICAGFLDESIRVQLFSKPQQTQESNTNGEPQEN